MTEQISPSVTNTTAPRFEHDCDQCHFLGHFQDADLYFHGSEHPHGTYETFIARFSAEPSDYASGMFSAFGSTDSLTEARVRAQAAGLLGYPRYIALSVLHGDCSAELLDELNTAWAGTPELLLLTVVRQGAATQDHFDQALASYLEYHAFSAVADTSREKLSERLGWFLTEMQKLDERCFPSVDQPGDLLRRVQRLPDTFWKLVEVFESKNGMTSIF